jgi:hypothetical protein
MRWKKIIQGKYGPVVARHYRRWPIVVLANIRSIARDDTYRSVDFHRFWLRTRRWRIQSHCSRKVAHVLLNNSQLGKISKEQRAGEWPVWQTDLHNPSFAAYANLCGGKGVRVTKAENLRSALDEMLAHSGPALVEIITDPDLI